MKALRRGYSVVCPTCGATREFTCQWTQAQEQMLLRRNEMKISQRGYTLIELVWAVIVIVALFGTLTAAAVIIHFIMKFW